MKTTEIFIEQVIIGFFIVLIAALPFFPEILCYFAGVSELENFISIAAGVVGGAYLLGIVFDRLADSLLRDLEQHHRLHYALFKCDAALWPDPWPEERLRIGILRASGSVVAYYDYLRSRMRLSRALAVFLPALTFAGVLALIRPDQVPPHGALLAILPLAYLLALIGCRTDPPKTYDWNAVRHYREAPVRVGRTMLQRHGERQVTGGS